MASSLGYALICSTIMVFVFFTIHAMLGNGDEVVLRGEGNILMIDIIFSVATIIFTLWGVLDQIGVLLGIGAFFNLLMFCTTCATIHYSLDNTRLDISRDDYYSYSFDSDFYKKVALCDFNDTPECKFQIAILFFALFTIMANGAMSIVVSMQQSEDKN